MAGKAKDIAIGTKTESAPNPSPILNSRKGFGLTIGYAATEFYAYHDMGGDMDTYLERWGIGKNLSSSEKATAYAAR